MRKKRDAVQDRINREQIEEFLARDSLTDDDRIRLKEIWNRKDSQFIDYIKRLREEKESHSGYWLTLEAVKAYRSVFDLLPDIYGYSDIGERRALRIVFQKIYGLLEVESINILNGFHIAYYITKYDKIRNEIPAHAKGDRTHWVSAEAANLEIDTKLIEKQVIEEIDSQG